MGTTQHLKNKFGAGYMLDIKLGMGQSTDWNSVEARLKVMKTFLCEDIMCILNICMQNRSIFAL